MSRVSSSPPAPGAASGTWAAPLVAVVNDLKTAVNGLGTAADSDATTLRGGYGSGQAAATMLRASVNNNTVACTVGDVTFLPFSVAANFTLSNICFIVGTQFAGTTLFRVQVGTYDETTKVFTPLAESADLHTTVTAATAGTEMACPLSNTGRLASTPTSLALVVGTRYAYSLVNVGSTAGSIRGNGNITAVMASLTPAVVKKLSGQTDAPTAATAALSNGSASYFLVYGT